MDQELPLGTMKDMIIGFVTAQYTREPLEAMMLKVFELTDEQYIIRITDPGSKKINTIKFIRAVTSSGLKEAKDASEGSLFPVSKEQYYALAAGLDMSAEIKWELIYPKPY